MSGLDIFVLILLAVGAFRGWRRGFVSALFTIVGFFAGLILAYMLNSQLGTTLVPYIGTSVRVARLICFFLLWVVIPLGFGFVGHMFTKLLDVLHLGFLDRLAGAVVGALKYFTAISCIVAFFSFWGIGREAIDSSVTCSFMNAFTKSFITAVPEAYKNGR